MHVIFPRYYGAWILHLRNSFGSVGEDKEDEKDLEQNFHGHPGLKQNVVGWSFSNGMIVLKGNLSYVW